MDIWGKHQLPNLLTNQENINTNLRSVEKSFFDDNWIDFGKVDKLSQRNRSILAVKNDKDVDNLFEKRTFLPSAVPEEYDWGIHNISFTDSKEIKDTEHLNGRTSISPNQQPLYRISPESGWNAAKNVGLFRKCRTPSPYMLNHKGNSSSSNVNVNRKNVLLSDGADRDKTFKPIPFTSNTPGNTPVELHVTNLDQSIDAIDIKKILLAIFGEHVMVLHVSVFVQSDGIIAAYVKVPSIQDAQYAISQLHRRKIGHKKIIISYGHSGQPHSPQFIRWQVVSLLKEVPGLKLPLFKFLEMFESRYVTTISVSDLYRLKDVCVITDESSGRMVSLHSNHRNTPSPCLTLTQDVEPYCMKHYKVRQCPNKGWAEQEVPPLPNVLVSLPMFSANLLHLLATHNNVLPLASFCDCYNAECESLTISEAGVPLEHLVTCVHNVDLALANGVKYLKPSATANDKHEDSSVAVSPSLANVLNLFGRELVDLLKTQMHCQLLFNRFIPAYHHHFGRQCRVADYGFTKLIDLLEALPNIIQVIGEGNKRIVTLSHRAQIRRFTSDLLRALKTQPYKRMTLSELPGVFERVLGKPFDPVDYGLSFLIDLVDQLSKTTVQVIPAEQEDDFVLAIPKREQTPCEIERTKQFAKEVIELLGHAPQCSILFNKFIPAYHHHYGHQCRVADFGFTKLIELFEAIPDIVKLEEDIEGERRVILTQCEKLRVLGEQICDLVTPCCPPGLPLSSLETTFLWQFGYSLKPDVYCAKSIEQLVLNLQTIKLVDSDIGKMIVPVEEALIKHLTDKVKRLLISSDEGRMAYSQMICSFNAVHEKYIQPDNLLILIPEAVQVDVKEENEIFIKLTPLYQLARRISIILAKNEGRLTISSLENAYFREHQQSIHPNDLGYSNLQSLLAALPEILVLRGKGLRRVVLLNKEILQKKYTFSNENSSELQIFSKTSEFVSLKSSLKENNNDNGINLCESEKNANKISLKRSGLFGTDSETTIDFNLEPRNVQERSSFPKIRRIRLAAQFENPIDLN
uniref:HTH OST-type domain-containing protein n=1 Tax=Rhodnius prolixus TaxID=13249 RepID=T1IAR4_RHOPR